MICKKCNFQNESGARFCKNCGAKLTQQKSDLPKKQKPFLWIVGGAFIAALVIIAAIFVFSKNQNNDLAKMNLKGNVNFISQKTYRVINETTEQKEDKALYPIEYLGLVYGNYKLFKQTIVGWDFFLCNDSYFDIYFNKAGNIDKILWGDSDGTTSINYKYNEEEKKINAHWGFGMSVQYQYSLNNNIGSVIQCNDRYCDTICCTYDYKGNLVNENYEDNENLDYNYSEKKLSRVKLTYHYNSDGSKKINIWNYEYDSKGNIANLKTQFSDHNMSTYKNSYGGFGKKAEDRSFETEWTFTYEFDSRGNWIKRFEYVEIKDTQGINFDEIDESSVFYFLKNIRSKHPREKILYLITEREIKYN